MFYTFSSRKAERDTRTGMAALAPACRAGACPCMAPGPGGEEERRRGRKWCQHAHFRTEGVDEAKFHISQFSHIRILLFFKCSEVERQQVLVSDFHRRLTDFPVNKPEH